METVSFGIGCYMFEAHGQDLLGFDNRDGKYTTVEWAEDVRKALEAIPSVDSIDIATPRGTTGSVSQESVLQIPTEMLRDNAYHPGGYFFPHPIDGHVTFRVTIPQHIQNKYSHGRSLKSTEFTVEIRFEGRYPVAFVSMMSDEDSPSTAVMIVREFLRSEFEQRKELVAPISFTCLGPSPFWVDCWVEASPVEGRVDENDGLEFELEHTRQEGYDDMLFTGQAPSARLLFERVQEEVVHELAQFYSLVSERNLLMSQDAWNSHQLEELLTLQHKKGIGPWFQRLWSSGRKSLSLSLQILHTENRAARFDRTFSNGLEEHYALHTMKPFEPWIIDELKRMKTDRRSDLREMAGLLASSHSKSAEIVAVVGASLGGGAIGAALTAIAGSGAS